MRRYGSEKVGVSCIVQKSGERRKQLSVSSYAFHGHRAKKVRGVVTCRYASTCFFCYFNMVPFFMTRSSDVSYWWALTLRQLPSRERLSECFLHLTGTTYNLGHESVRHQRMGYEDQYQYEHSIRAILRTNLWQCSHPEYHVHLTGEPLNT
jgi:hypothetical protein